MSLLKPIVTLVNHPDLNEVKRETSKTNPVQLLSRIKPNKYSASYTKNRTIILFNKPFDTLSQFTDGQGRKTLADYISVKEVYAAGRLDRDSEGLMVLTNDGILQAKLNATKIKIYQNLLGTSGWHT